MKIPPIHPLPVLQRQPQQDVLKNLQVASPCPASWAGMAGDERVRHCTECNLNVYNFSEMNRREIEQLLMQHEGRLCGRLFRRADGTILTRDCPRGLRAAARRVSRMLSAALSAIMSVSFAAAQAPSKNESQQHMRNEKKEAGITLTVLDQSGEIIADAEVVLTATSGDRTIKGKTGSDGVWHVAELAKGPYIMIVNRHGFTSDTRMVTVQEHQTLDLQANLFSTAKMGQIVIRR